MSTLKHLDLALIDLRDRLTRELQFSAEAEAQITAAIATVSDGLTHLDRTIRNAFAERNRALETALGSTAPAPAIGGPVLGVGAVGAPEPLPMPEPAPEVLHEALAEPAEDRPAKKRAA